MIEHLVGRLVGMRVGALSTMKVLDATSRRFFTVLEGVPGSAVVCADYRRLQVMNDDAEAMLTACMATANGKVQRSALLLPVQDEAVRFQMERVLREARNPSRRICVDSAEAKAWLCSVLSPAERKSLDAFLLAVRT